MRRLLIALFATAALPAVAAAQEPGRQVGEPSRFERETGDADRPAPPRRETPRPAADRGGDAREPGRQFRADVAVAAPAVQADVQARGGRDRGGNGGSGNGGGRDWQGRADPVQTVQQQPAIQPQAESRRDWNRNGGGRKDNGRSGWDRNRDGQPDLSRANNGRDWNGDRNRNGRPDVNRTGNGRNWNGDRNDRRDWNRDGRWNDNGRYSRNWDRSWRSNSRYDWQRYRSANRYAFRLPRYAAPYNWHYGYRRQSIGTYLFAGLFAQSYWIGNPWDYRLPPVEWPYRWVRYYDDALLVDTESGEVVDVIEGIFWY